MPFNNLTIPILQIKLKKSVCFQYNKLNSSNLLDYNSKGILIWPVYWVPKLPSWLWTIDRKT
jgi:hypothetical protein